MNYNSGLGGSGQSRRDEVEPEHSQDRWLVSYADFITLMFAFFAVLYATSQKDVEKAEKFQESIKRYLIKAGAFGESGPQLNQGVKNNSVIESPIQTFRPEKVEPATATDEAETYLESHLTKAERKAYVTDVVSDDWGVRIILPASALFADHSDKFREEAMPFVGKLSGLLAATQRKVLIEGHVGQGEVGSFHSTWEFASARALNFLRFVQRKEKLPSERLAAASLADSRPSHKGEQIPQNSRLEVVLLNSDMEF